MYSQLSPYGHLAITDNPLLRTLCKSPAKPITVNSRLTDTSLLRTTRYYGQPAITDNPLLRTLCKSPAKPITVNSRLTDTSLLRTTRY